MKSLLLVLVAIGLLNSASALFVECAAVGGLVGGLLTGVLGTVNTLVQQLLTGDNCIQTCANLGPQYNYAIFAKGLSLDLKTKDDQTLLGTCWCNANGLPPNTVIPGSDSQGTCTTTVLNLIGTRVDYIRSTATTFSGCSSSTGFPAGDNTVFSVSTADQCFNSAQCQTKRYISLRANGVTQLNGLLGLLNVLLGRTGGTFDCACSNSAPTGGAINCGTETASQNGLLSSIKTYAFSNFAQEVPSTAVRRRYAEQLRLAAEAERDAYCPSGKIACRVPGSSDYECIDTDSELESCGGCVYGSYTSNSTLTGTDCTAMPGVVAGASSCWRGTCVATRCKRGFTLVDGMCI